MGKEHSSTEEQNCGITSHSMYMKPAAQTPFVDCILLQLSKFNGQLMHNYVLNSYISVISVPDVYVI